MGRIVIYPDNYKMKLGVDYPEHGLQVGDTVIVLMGFYPCMLFQESYFVVARDEADVIKKDLIHLPADPPFAIPVDWNSGLPPLTKEILNPPYRLGKR